MRARSAATTAMMMMRFRMREPEHPRRQPSVSSSQSPNGDVLERVQTFDIDQLEPAL
jgi:hypothetical protein